MDCIVPSSPWLPFGPGPVDRFCEGDATTKRSSLADSTDASSMAGRAVYTLTGIVVVLAAGWGTWMLLAGRKAYERLLLTLLSGVAARILAVLPLKGGGGARGDLTSVSPFILVLGQRLDCRTKDLWA